MLLKAAFSLASPEGLGGRLSILVFHRVRPGPDPLFPNEPCVRRFDAVMEWVADWFNVLPLDQAVDRLKRGQLPARAAAITFDDGYADNLLYATPILKQHGLHATFFIATGFLDGGRMWNDTIIEAVRATTLPEIDASHAGLGLVSILTNEEKRKAIEQIISAVKHMPGSQRIEAVDRIRASCGATLADDLMLTGEQLRALRQAGMGVGAHTVNHPILAVLDSATSRREIAESRECLEGLLGEPVPLFAYPNGNYGRDYTNSHVELVKALGFTGAVSTNWGACSEKSDVYQLPRFTPWDLSRWRFGLRMLENFRGRRVAADVW